MNIINFNLPVNKAIAIKKALDISNFSRLGEEDRGLVSDFYAKLTDYLRKVKTP